MIESSKTMVNDAGLIQKGYTTQAAAEVLGVGRHEVVRLIHEGKLKAQRTSSNTYVVSEASLLGFNKAKRAKGRPWAAETAWAALDLLSGGEAEWLGYKRKWMLQKKLLEITAEEIVWISRNRQSVKTYKCSPSMIAVIQADTISTGCSVSSDTLHEIGLSASSTLVDGYVRSTSLERFAELHYLMESDLGEATLRLACGIPARYLELSEMPLGVVAADFAMSLNARERDCGLKCLEGLLNEYKEARR